MEQRNLLDYVPVLVKWRRLLVAGTLAATAAAAGVSLLLPERWTARTSLLPPEEEAVGIGRSLLPGAGGLPLGLAGLVGLPIPSERLLTLLQSRRLLGLAVDRHELVRVYEAPHRDAAIEWLSEAVESELGDDGSLVLRATAATPKLAADLANTLAALLDSLNREYRRRQASSLRGFLEGRVRSTREELGADASRLRDFQDAHGVVDIEAQTAAAVDVAKGLAFELSLKQVELGVLSRQVASDHADRQALAMRVDELDRQLRALVGDLSRRMGGAPGASERPLGPPLKELPGLMQDHAALTLQVKMREEVLLFLGAQLEEAKVREARDTPTLQVLDPATPPKARSAPRRALLTAAAGGSAAVLLVLLAFLLEAWQRDGAAHQQRLEAIRGHLRK
ncbi:MAG: Wzz/FepE/Etk N-terminal domain-containing protein [Gemmatimonadaceae bacterium]|nr:Wzz/FepE/Etk N-terminal domain-containing protein [Gemmatimonadaceae bacterium]